MASLSLSASFKLHLEPFIKRDPGSPFCCCGSMSAPTSVIIQNSVCSASIPFLKLISSTSMDSVPLMLPNIRTTNEFAIQTALPHCRQIWIVCNEKKTLQPSCGLILGKRSYKFSDFRLFIGSKYYCYYRAVYDDYRFIEAAGHATFEFRRRGIFRKRRKRLVFESIGIFR